jgi:hypothetical protein
MNDKAIPELDVARAGAPAKDFTVPVWDAVLQKTVQRSLATVLGLASSDARGGIKYVRYFSSGYFGVTPSDSTLDTIDAATLCANNEAVVLNTSTTPTSTSGPSVRYVLARCASTDAGAMLVPVDDKPATTDVVWCKWVELDSAAGAVAAFEEFDEEGTNKSGTYPNGSSVKTTIGGAVRLFEAKKTLNVGDFATGKIPAPTGSSTDAYWLEVSPPGNLFEPITANQYGTHPAFNSQTALNAYLLGRPAQIVSTPSTPTTPVAPAAPTDGQVDDTANTFSGLAVAGFPSFAEYEAFGFPGVAGTVPLTSANSHQQGSRIYLDGLAGPIQKGAVGFRVAASGTRPAGAYLLNVDTFTGVAPPTGTKATAPVFGTIDDVNNTVTLTSIYAYSEIRWGIEGGIAQLLAPNSVCSPGNITGRLFAYAVADASANRLQSDVVYSAPFSVAASANNAPTATVSVAGGTSSVTTGQPVTLNANAVDSDAGDTITKLEYLDNGVKMAGGETPGASGSFQTPGLAAGSHSFTVRATDSRGGVGLSNAVVVTAAAAGPGGGTVVTGLIGFAGFGDSIEKANQAALEAGYAVDAGTTPYQTANQATGNSGRQTSTERAADLINAAYPNKVEAFTLGYPSMTSFWFKRNILPHVLDTIDFSKYEVFCIVLAFGANDLIYPDPSHSPADSTTPADIYANLVSIAQTLSAVNPKVRVFISPTLNRTYNNPSTGVQQAEFVDFDSRRQELNRLLLTNLNSFAAGAANIYAQPIGLAGMCYNYPNAEVTDGSHPTAKGQGEIGLERARMLARYANLTLPQGNGTAPVPPAANTAPGYSTTSGFVIWEGGDGEAAVDATNARRIYKTSNTAAFGGTKFSNVLARYTPGSTVQWQFIVQVKAGAGDTQIVSASANLGITHYQDGIAEVYWNGSNLRIYEGVTELYSAALSSDFPVQVVATDKIRFYRVNTATNTATLLATTTAAPPQSDVCIFAEMGGQPVNGKPEITDVQFFPATPVPRSGGSGGPANPGGVAFVTETVIANPSYTQNLTQNANDFSFLVGGTGYTRDKFTTGTKKILQAYAPGLLLSTLQVAQPAANDLRARFIAISNAPIQLGASDWLSQTRWLLYWDGSVIRTFVNGGLHVNGLSWLSSVVDFAIGLSSNNSTVAFMQNNTLMDSISDSADRDLYVTIGGGESGVIIPATTIYSNGLSTY